MKKILKSIILNFILMLTFVISISSVKAVAAGDQMNFNSSDKNLVAKDTLDSLANHKSEYYRFFNYSGTFTTGNNVGQTVKLYCVDPNEHPNAGEKVREITVNDVINFENVNAGNLVDQAKFYGLAMILQNGAHSTNASAYNLIITDMAVRAYTYLVFHDSNIMPFKAADDFLASGLLNLAKDASVLESGLQSNLRNELGINFNVSSNLPNAQMRNLYAAKEDYVGGAKELIKIGFKKALEFKTGNGLNASVNVRVTPRQNNALDEFKAEVEEKIYSFTIKQLSEGQKGYVKIGKNDIKCNNCEKYGIKIAKVEYQDKSGKWQALPEEQIDLAAYVGKTGTALIKVTLNKQITLEENCGASISLKYLVPSPINIQVLFVNKSSNGYQRYIGGLMTGSDSQIGSTTKQFTEQLSCLTVPCDTEIETPVCSPNSEGIATVKAPSDIKRCIIGKIDDASNVYQAIDGINNDYCGTFCKEDYREIALNRALNNVNCGRYFKLQARIEGSKDCYRGSEYTSDKAIDIAKYNQDMIDIQESYIENHDTVLMTDAAAGNTGSIESECDEYGDKKDKDGNQLKTEENCTKHTWTLSGTYSGVEVANTNTTTGSVTSKTKSGTYTYTSTTSAEDISTQISDDASEAKENLSNLDVNYNNTITQFNACTKEWNSKYNFDPKVYWEYGQNFETELGDVQLDTTYNDLLSKEDRALAPVEATRKNTESLEACIGTTDNKLENCSTGWTSTDSVFVERTYTKCNADGCSSDKQSISQAKFVKQHFTVEQDYDTPTVYYQVVSSGPSSGSIITYKDYHNPNIPPLSPINGLPLAGDTTGGGVFKLKIEDLGEFYDYSSNNPKDRLGRLIDFEGDKETHSVAFAKGYEAEDNWSGDYVCYYLTNCRPKECPDCKFVCVGEYCHWENCPECTYDCINCIYNLGDLQLNMKPVSITSFNESAGREYGYNWNINVNLADFPELEMVRDKADETIKEIEENNTTIYDDTNIDSNDSTLEFSIDMTPKIIEDIRQYNKSKDGVGGYNDASLVCYDYEDQNGKLQKNVFCYSTFIDEMIAKYGDNVHPKTSRGDASSRNNESVLNSGYWTPWSEYGNTQKYGESVIGGPSWK